ncbi:uncharacterized protein BDW47DRAFT_102292 [Aspergillus candidus]|uniref:Uncharacterized protein n=1 Tax=Aspergillus candidus TaxID=41067 RepID=A0A2I2FHL4_ASPCN|nr:hypothetical protein BDW47DRAFT_102292 [Aspergillus candidus]PLB40128.1 hypothetical protein BDW47DRAFT_102292 [Aspergillus candidus]
MLRDCPTARLHILNHQYLESDLSFDRLEGFEKAQVAGLQKACDIEGMGMFLATFVEEASESDDDACHSTRSLIPCGQVPRASLSRVIDTSDSIVVEGMKIKGDIFLDYEALHHSPNTVVTDS